MTGWVIVWTGDADLVQRDEGRGWETTAVFMEPRSGSFTDYESPRAAMIPAYRVMANGVELPSTVV